MPEEDTPVINQQDVPPRVSEVRRFLKVFLSRPIVIVGMIIILAFLLTAALANFISPYGPFDRDMYHVLAQPSAQHLLGTDTLGRDILSRIIFGSRISLMVGVVALGIAAMIGNILGLIAGYFGGRTYAVIMRFIDALMSFPMILLALVIASLLGGGLVNVMLSLGVALLPGFCRLMCGQVLSVKSTDYVLALHSLGASDRRIMFRHVLPNSFPPLIVLVTMMIGMTILAEASLSFLGVGIEPPAPAWGAMVNVGYPYLISNPILSVAPGVAIMLVVFGFNMVGDGLRDALDPRLRGIL
jgi:peptide/nickel transport system permease protein